MRSATALLEGYWSLSVVEINLLLFANLSGALLLGLIVGYERSYHSRAAGMRTYGIVCMASCALTVFAGYPGYWWGLADASHLGPIDPTRVVQGIVTGIGFLGAGVIMRDGLSISGLTTAASIWATAAIGVLVGVGFYPAAILLALLCASLMMWGVRVEARLPALQAAGVTLGFLPGHEPDDHAIKAAMHDWGYAMAEGSLHITLLQAQVSWQFVLVARQARPRAVSLFELARLLRGLEGVDGLQLTHARN